MRRRDFMMVTGAALGQAAFAATGTAAPDPASPTQGQHAQHAGATHPRSSAAVEASRAADYTLRIAPAALEIAPSHFVSTIAYNGISPGPLLRLKEGHPVTVDVINETDAAELVHWHGLYLPPEIDGAQEEGTPAIPPGGRARYRFIPSPAGTRWYHTHAMAMGDLHRGSYTGQYGYVIVDAAREPGRYDQEVFLALRDWEPFYTDQPIDTDDQDTPGPQPERPAVLDTRPNGLEPASQLFSINDKALGAGEPIRVRQGSRVLFRLLNASALENRTIALPGHVFVVLALDGNPVPTPRATRTVTLGPGERVDAYVDMNRPGVWILGSTFDPIRNAGLGVVIEYANAPRREPQWAVETGGLWDYTGFGYASSHAPARPRPDRTLDLVFEKIPGGARPFNLWMVNGKPYPHAGELVLHKGLRYRLNFRNRTDDAHPVHLHRHRFELVDVNGRPTSGVIKDTVIVPVYGRVAVDLVADQPGATLFHCHIQQHMDFGFKALFRYG